MTDDTAAPERGLQAGDGQPVLTGDGEVRRTFGQQMRRWVSPGPVVDAYLRSTAEVRMMQGPVGSGKTGGWIGGITVNAMRQPMWPDGVRRHRALVLREDFRKLWGNLLPTWWEWHPQDASYGEWSGSKDGPADHRIYLQTARGKVILHVMFRAIGAVATDEEVTSFFRGVSTGDIVMEEADTFREVVYTEAVTRLGRYPPVEIGAAVTPALFGVMNAPLVGTWAHTNIVKQVWKPGVEYFRQPGAFEKGAENLHNLRPGYYDTIVKYSKARTVRRTVYNEFVLPQHGQPVFPDFQDWKHTASPDIEPRAGVKLILGLDAGGSPAGVFMQRMPDTGQWRIYDEVVTDAGTGVDRFARELNRLLSEPRYAPWRNRRGDIVAVSDPSADFGADKVAGELNWRQKLAAKTGLRITPARTNKVEPRREAVRGPLITAIDDGVPGLLLSPRCETLRIGWGGMYHYAQIRAGEDRFSETPTKDKYSHPSDAAEYGLLEDGGYEEAIGRTGHTLRPGASQPRQTAAISDNNPSGSYARPAPPWPINPASSRQRTAG